MWRNQADRGQRWVRRVTWRDFSRAAVLAAFAVAVLAATAGSTALAQSKSTSGKKPAASSSTGPQDFTSQNFILHTDLSADDAKELLQRLETMLKLISAYWAKPLRGQIECYVVEDLSNWPPGSIPSEDGLESIQNGAGVTITQRIGRGQDFQAKAVVYAVADRGTPQHEAVHAYCGQTFGTTGPTWYAEGMAEMGQYWKEKDPSVNCHPEVLKYLQGEAPKSLNEIVNSNERTGDSWQNYAWRWALCHLLANNKNYADRFRPLGLGILEERDVSFNQTYGPMATEISFEYLFFLKHVCTGFRADLCSWDWKKKFLPLKTGSVAVKVDAQRGWQPTGAVVTADAEYEYTATGNWKISKSDQTTADGNESGQGRLVACVVKPFELGGSLELENYMSAPIELGAKGTFTANGDGRLFVRCQDEWGELSDNSGKVNLKLKAQGKGKGKPGT